MRRLGLLTGVAVALALPAPAAATDFSVTTLADLGGTVCGSPCSLRQAINAANTTVSVDGSADVIHLPVGTLERNPAFEAVQVTAAVVIVGTGARTTTIAGSPNPGFSSRALSVASASPIDVELRDLSVADGLVEGSAAVPPEGGGIRVTGAHLTLRRVTVRDNQVLDARGAAAGSVLGGGIFTDGALTLEHVTIRDNRAIGTWASGNNTISASGGGAFVRGAGTSIRNSTVADNAADGGPGLGSAGGLGFSAGAQLDGVTVTGNRAGGTKGASGGNISSGFVPPTVSGSIIADGRGSATSGNCARALTSGGGNLEDTGQCGLTSASDRTMTDPGSARSRTTADRPTHARRSPAARRSTSTRSARSTSTSVGRRVLRDRRATRERSSSCPAPRLPRRARPDRKRRSGARSAWRGTRAASEPASSVTWPPRCAWPAGRRSGLAERAGQPAEWRCAAGPFRSRRPEPPPCGSRCRAARSGRCGTGPRSRSR